MNEDIERRADVKMIKVKGPDGRMTMKKAPRKEVEIGKGKLESTDAYAQALDRVRHRKQMSGISTSDRDKLGKVADMMKKERDKRKNTDPNHPSNKMKAAGFNEAADPSKYKAGSEPSKFGGHRPHLKNPEGKTSYLGGTAYKTAAHASGEAAAYHKGYFHSPGSKASERGADRAVRAYREKHKEHIVTRESVEEGVMDKIKAGVKAVKDFHKTDTAAQIRKNKTTKTLPEAKDHPAAADLHAYAKKHGGIDKEYFQSAANHIAAGRHRELAMHVRNGDTEPRDHVLDTIHKHDKSLSDKIHKAAGFKRLREEEQVDEYITGKQIRMARGIAFDKRHKGGDYTGAAKKMEKIKKGLSNHPAAKKALRQANEEKDGIDQHPEVRKAYDAMVKTKPDSYERRRAVRALMNKKKELRYEKEEIELDEISSKLARKAAAASGAKHYEYSSSAYGPGADKESDRLEKKADKARAHVQKRQGDKGSAKVDRLTNKLVFGRSRMGESRLMSMQEVAGQRGRPKRGEDAASDSHIIMQLRSAQDLGGKKDIKFRGGRTAQVHPKHIDKILKYHDHPSLKPVDKRRLRVAISKSHDHLKRVADAIK